MSEKTPPQPASAPVSGQAGPDRVTAIAMAIVAFMGAACLAWAASLTAG